MVKKMEKVFWDINFDFDSLIIVKFEDIDYKIIIFINIWDVFIFYEFEGSI